MSFDLYLLYRRCANCPFFVLCAPASTALKKATLRAAGASKKEADHKSASSSIFTLQKTKQWPPHALPSRGETPDGRTHWGSELIDR